MCEDAGNFCREIEISPDSTFLDLRNAILDSVGYTKDEINTFFVCDDDWRRGQEIAIENFDSRSDCDTYLMDSTSISELVDEEGQKLEFMFDILMQRSFIMELKEIRTGVNLKTPQCTRKIGNPPAQTDFDGLFDSLDISPKAPASPEMDMDFYGDSEFNEDELDSGFDDMKFE